MKNFKTSYNNVKKSLGAISLSIVLGTMSMGGLTGCSKDNKYESEYSSTIYNVQKSDDQRAQEKKGITTLASKFDIVDSDYSRYDRYIDFNEIISDINMGYDYTYNNIDYVYPVKTGNFKSHFFEDDKIKSFENENRDYITMSNGTFRAHSNFVLPDSIKWAEKKFGNGKNENSTDELIEIEHLLGANGNVYMHYEYTVSATKDIETNGYFDSNYIEKYGLPRDIKKGDYIHYESLCMYDKDNNKFIRLADKQTGIGSNSKNVKKAVLGNYDQVIKPITLLNEKSNDKTFDTNQEFKNYVKTR